MSVNQKILIIVIVGLLLVIILYLTRFQKPLFGNLDGYFGRQGPPLGNLQKQSGEEGDVAIDATPVMFSSAGVDFSVRFTTHSLDLDFDLLEKTELQNDKGETLKPVSWDGGKGGHHLSGNLKFPSFNERVSLMRLVIKDVAGVSQRIFEWKI